MTALRSTFEKLTAALRPDPRRPRLVPITVTGRGFAPATIGVLQHQPTTLVFKRTTDATCAKKVAFPELGIEADLPLGESVSVELPIDAARTLTFHCGMGMFRSSIVIE